MRPALERHRVRRQAAHQPPAAALTPEEQAKADRELLGSPFQKPGELSWEAAFLPAWSHHLAHRANTIGARKIREAQEKTQRHKKLQAELDALTKKPEYEAPTGAMPLQVEEGHEEEFFTPAELLNIRNDYNFATKVYKKVSQRQYVDPQDVRDFQERVATTYPDLVSEVAQREGQSFREHTPVFASDTLSPELKAIKDRYLHGPEIIQRFRTHNPGTTNSDIQIRSQYGHALKKTEEYLQDRVKRGLINDSNFDILDLLRDVPEAKALSHQDVQYLGQALDNYFEKEQAAPAAETAELFQPLNKEQRDALFNRLGKHEEQADLLRSHTMLAPFNEHHTAAEKMVYKSARETREAAEDRARRFQRAEDIDVRDAMEADLAKAGIDPKHVAEEHNPRMQHLLDRMRDMYKEQWEEDMAPAISGAYAVMGATHSGAHGATLQKAKERHNRDFIKKATEVLYHDYERAHKAAETQQEAAERRAQIRGQGAQHQQHHLKGMEQLRAQAEAGHKAQTASDIGLLGQLATSQQQQEQNEINEREAAAQRVPAAQEHGLAIEHAIRHGTQMPAVAPSLLLPFQQPRAPNPYYGVGAGLGGMAHMGGNFNTATGHAKGGHVKNKFASGGMPNWAQLGQQVEYSPQHQQQEQIANELRHYDYNPVSDWMALSGARLGQIAGGPGMKALGEGLELSVKNKRDAYNQSRQDKIHAANLHHQIQQSLMTQRQLIGDYESRRANVAETQRHHGMMEGIAHKKMMAKAAAMAPQFSKEQEKVIREQKTNIENALKLKGTIAKMKDSFGRLDTGPRRGWLAQQGHDTTAATAGLGSIKDIQKARSLASQVILQAHQGMKNIPRSEAFLERIDQTKPNFLNVPEVNAEVADYLEEGPDLAFAHARHELKNIGLSDAQIEAYFDELGAAQKSHKKPLDKAPVSKKAKSTASIENRRNALLQERAQLLGH